MDLKSATVKAYEDAKVRLRSRRLEEEANMERKVRERIAAQERVRAEQRGTLLAKLQGEARKSFQLAPARARACIGYVYREVSRQQTVPDPNPIGDAKVEMWVHIRSKLLKEQDAKQRESIEIERFFQILCVSLTLICVICIAFGCQRRTEEREREAADFAMQKKAKAEAWKRTKADMKVKKEFLIQQKKEAVAEKAQLAEEEEAAAAAIRVMETKLKNEIEVKLEREVDARIEAYMAIVEAEREEAVQKEKEETRAQNNVRRQALQAMQREVSEKVHEDRITKASHYAYTIPHEIAM